MIPENFREAITFAVGSPLMLLEESATAEGLSPGEFSDLQRRLENYDRSGWHEADSTVRFLPGAFDDVCILLRILNRAFAKKSENPDKLQVGHLFWLFAAFHAHDEIRQALPLRLIPELSKVLFQFAAQPSRGRLEESKRFAETHLGGPTAPPVLEHLETLLKLCTLPLG